jgi:hypothetical protein
MHCPVQNVTQHQVSFVKLKSIIIIIIIIIIILFENETTSPRPNAKLFVEWS